MRVQKEERGPSRAERARDPYNNNKDALESNTFQEFCQKSKLLYYSSCKIKNITDKGQPLQMADVFIKRRSHFVFPVLIGCDYSICHIKYLYQIEGLAPVGFTDVLSVKIYILS